MHEDESMIISLDDPEFQNQQVYDPEQDIDSRVPPPELDLNGNVRDYMFKLSIGENKQGEKKPYAAVSQKGTKYIALQVKAQVVAPGEPYDNAFVNFPFGAVTTIPFNGTNAMVDLSRKLGSPMPPKLGQLDQAAYIASLLESEPIVPGRLVWTGYCSNCKKEIPGLTGERKWPEKKDEQGNVIGHLSVTECNECGEDITANPKIKKLAAIK